MFFNKNIRFAIRSPKWQTVRKNHLILNPICAACGKFKKLEVHHIVPVHVDPSKELDPDNLMTLCADPCHILFGHLMDFKSWNSGVNEDCKEYYQKILDRPYK